MNELDDRLRAALRQEADRAGDVSPRPLSQLEARAARRRRRAWIAPAVGAAAAAAVVLATVQLWPGTTGGARPAAGPDLPDDANVFTVPTYDWDRGWGMDALLTGRLGFTEDGCTLIYQQDDPASVGPVVFPDAVGVTFGNGVRAVVHEDSGKVYAVEGREFEYAGGWITVRDDTWSGQCGEWPASVAWINDDPAADALTTDPPPPDDPAPTRVATEEEMGRYAVPTLDWDPAAGGETALLEGTVTMTEDGCAVVLSGEPPRTTGLVLPHAHGQYLDDGRPVIYSEFPDGSGALMAEEGLEVSFAGGSTARAGELGEQWDRLCPASPVDSLFVVQDTLPWR